MKKLKKILSYTIYWLIQCTWGIIMTLIGAIAALGLILTGHKPKTMGPTVYFEVGENWGGLELGGFFLCCKGACDNTKYHECGHSVQNMIWGPLMPFVISIPSALRYWMRELPTILSKHTFNIIFMLSSLLLTTISVCFTGACFHWHWITLVIESFRVYLIMLSIWLAKMEIPKYENGPVPYDAIWFEGQATRWGHKFYEKKED